MLVRKTMNRKSSKSGAPARKSSPGRDAAVQNGTFPVVAIGASAGGLEAYKEFFHALPSATGMAYVLVQHLDPSHHSMLTEIIAKATAMPVEEVKSGERSRPDCVYVIPPNAFISISEGVFTLTPRSKGPGQHLAVNFFMRSLAESHGASRYRFFRHWGGRHARPRRHQGGRRHHLRPGAFHGPVLTVWSGIHLEDACILVRSPRSMAREIEADRRHSYLSRNKVTKAERDKDLEDAAAPQAGPEGDLTAVLDQLRKSSGVDFSQYKPNTIHRRTLRRMVILKLDSLDKYARYLKEHPEEANKLFDDVLDSRDELFAILRRLKR